MTARSRSDARSTSSTEASIAPMARPARTGIRADSVHPPTNGAATTMAKMAARPRSPGAEGFVRKRVLV